MAMEWQHWVALLSWLVYSRLCLRWPHALVPSFIRQRRGWSKRPRHESARHISHRGGAGENLENTMEAFRHAVTTCRTDILELDIHETADGVPVVCHDANLERLTGDSVEIKDILFKDLPKLKPVLQVCSQPDGVETNPEDRPQSQSWVTLNQVFDAFPGSVFNIDLKQGSPQLADRVASAIFKRGIQPNVIWGSDSSAELTAYLYDKYPDIPLLFGTRGVIRAVILYWLGLLPFVTFQESYFQPPHSWCYVLRNHKSLKTTSWKEWFKYRVLTFLFMQASLFAHLSARGIPVWMWTINDEDGFDDAFKRYCVDGVMTDYPSKLRKYIDTKM